MILVRTTIPVLSHHHYQTALDHLGYILRMKRGSEVITERNKFGARGFRRLEFLRRRGQSTAKYLVKHENYLNKLKSRQNEQGSDNNDAPYFELDTETTQIKTDSKLGSDNDAPYFELDTKSTQPTDTTGHSSKIATALKIGIPGTVIVLGLIYGATSGGLHEPNPLEWPTAKQKKNAPDGSVTEQQPKETDPVPPTVTTLHRAETLDRAH